MKWVLNETQTSEVQTEEENDVVRIEAKNQGLMKYTGNERGRSQKPEFLKTGG